MLDRIFIITAAAAPKVLVDKVAKLLDEADFEVSPRVYIGISFWVSYILAFLAFSLSLNILGFYESVGVGVVSFCVSEFMFLVVITLIADNRAKKIEEALPDALAMISANMRAGMTIENAVLASARPEFGPLEDEIRLVSSKTYGGMAMSQAFREMADRVRSKTLKRAIRLIIEGSSLGGQMAQLLYEISRDIRQISSLQREIRNQTLTYAIFIVFSTVIASPVLFATSIYYAELNEKVSASIDVPAQLPTAAGATGISFLPNIGKPGAGAISASDLTSFAIATVLVTTFFSALTIGLIQYGRASAGIKFIPFFVIGGLGLFFVAHFVLMEVFKVFVIA